MYKFLLIFFVYFFSAQQKCNFSFYNNSLSQEGSIVFRINNTGKEKVKIPKQFPTDFAIPLNIQVYNDEEKDYINTNYKFDGPSCGDIKQCFGKMICLKKGDHKDYEVKIILGRISKAFKEKKKYRFKLAFDTYLFSGCKSYVTDWLYYDNTK